MEAQGRDDSRHEQGRGPWQGGRRQGQRDEDDYPQGNLGGGSVYEEGRAYGQTQSGYGDPRAGGYGSPAADQSIGRRDYGGGPQGGYPEGGFGGGGYGQPGDELGPAGGPPRYSGAGYGGGEPTYAGYGRQEELRGGSQRQDYGPGQGQQAYVSYGGASNYRRRQSESYGQGREPASGAFGGAGLGGYSEGSSDVGRGLASAFGYGEQPAYQQAGYGRPQQEDSTTERRGGGFRGRGPKGYQRSDERINDEVCQRLCDDDFIDATDIEVTVSAGEVTLSGTAPDRQSRRRAEDLVEQVSGVQHVQNNLRVNRPR